MCWDPASHNWDINQVFILSVFCCMVSLLAFLGKIPEVHPVLGEMVACAAVSLHQCTLQYIVGDRLKPRNSIFPGFRIFTLLST